MWCGPWIPGSTPTADGRTLKLLNVIDEFTRECPVIRVDRRIDADAVVAVLDRLALERGVPGYVRFDNARNSLRMLSLTGAGSLPSTPSSSTRDRRGRTRGSNRSTVASATNRLNLWRFDSLLEARVIIEDWRIDYNTRRPHTAHDDTTPAEFTAASTTTNQPQVAQRLDHSTGPSHGSRAMARKNQFEPRGITSCKRD